MLNTNPDGAKLLAIIIKFLFLKMNTSIDKNDIIEKIPSANHADGTWTYIILTESPCK